MQKDRTGTWDISCLAAVVEWCEYGGPHREGEEP
jgi:hypothetical protein